MRKRVPLNRSSAPETMLHLAIRERRKTFAEATRTGEQVYNRIR